MRSRKEMRAMALSDVVARLHGHPRSTDPPVTSLPRSQISVLDDEVELRAAVERAIAFERDVALRAAEKISRYEQMAQKATVSEFPAVDSEVVVPTASTERPA
jgi:hypothetical protein